MINLDKYNILYELSQEVLIKDIERKAIVEEISISIFGITYRVGYWNNGDRHSSFVAEQEIMGIR